MWFWGNFWCFLKALFLCEQYQVFLTIVIAASDNLRVSRDLFGHVMAKTKCQPFLTIVILYYCRNIVPHFVVSRQYVYLSCLAQNTLVLTSRCNKVMIGMQWTSCGCFIHNLIPGFLREPGIFITRDVHEYECLGILSCCTDWQEEWSYQVRTWFIHTLCKKQSGLVLLCIILSYVYREKEVQISGL